jgi:hypothetical protein
MPPLPIVEALEVLEELGAGRRPGGPGRVVDQLDLLRQRPLRLEYAHAERDRPAPASTLSSISPATVGGGGGAFTLTATGTNFTPTSAVQVNEPDDERRQHDADHRQHPGQ